MLKEKGIDRSDFSKLLSLPTHRFGVEMHKRIVEETAIVQNEKSVFDVADINRILVKYPTYFSWVIVEAEIINEAYEKAERDYEDWYKCKYAEVANTMPGKPTINMIEAKVVQTCKQEKIELHRKLNAEGYSEEEIADRLRYEGFDGRRNYILELKSKSNIAKGMVKVWTNAISSLQSLSKNMAAEIELIKRNMGV